MLRPHHVAFSLINRILLAGAILFSSPALFAQVEVAPGVVYDNWGTADGLPVNSVNGIAQTTDGYLWLATYDGLVRFDGVRFSVFTSRTTPELVSNRINDVAVDEDGTLWVIHDEDGGLVRYRAGRFERVSVEAGRPADMRQFYRQNGALRIGGRYGVWEIDGGEIRTLWYSEERGDQMKVYEGTGGVRWIQQGEDLPLLRIEGADTMRFGPREPTHVLNVYPDPARPGVAWINAVDGNYRFADGQLERVDRAQGEVFEDGHYFRDQRGTLLVGTDGALYRVDEQTGRARGNLVLREKSVSEWWAFEWDSFADQRGRDWIIGGNTVLLDGQPILSLLSDAAYVTSSLLDAEGNLWIGTVREGLHRLRPSMFTTYAVGEGLLSSNVYAVVEAPDSALWFGTLGGGVSRLAGGSVQSWQRPDAPVIVFDVLPLASGELVVGGGGLGRAESFRNPRFTGYEPSFNPGGTSPGIRALHQSPDGCLWIGAELGVFRSCKGERVLLSGNDAPTHVVRAFLRTRDGALWMATAGGGLSVYRDGAFTHVTAADGLSSDRIRGLLEDDEGMLWIATEDAGLNRIDRSPDGSVQRIVGIDKRSGLFDDALHALVDDGMGRFWMSTNRGIFWVRRDDLSAYVDGRSRRVFSVSYDESAGLRDREANGGGGSPITRASDGRLWFATQAGAVVIDPREVDDTGVFVRSVIEGIAADTFALAVSEAIQESIRLPMSARDVTISYTGLYLTRPNALRFRYRLNPDQPWTEAGGRREAIFTDLSPGRYTFEVIASAYPGQWPESGAPLSFVVPAAFYETGWFRLVLMALAALTLIGIPLARVRQVQRRERTLNALVQERTRDLKAQTQQTEEALAQVEEQAGKLTLLDQAKSRFFANISHEFRTPLTLTLGPLEDLNDGYFGDLGTDAAEQVELAYRNAQRLLRLTNQMLDLSRLESGALDLVRAPMDLRAVLSGIVQAFESAAERKGIRLELDLPAHPLTIDADATRVDEVFVNLIGNAFKFTPQGEGVVVAARQEGGRVVVEVTDTGVGIAVADLPHIFERFYQGERGQSPSVPGTGVGLALSRELVELHDGTIQAESVVGEGSRFVVSFPASLIGVPVVQMGDLGGDGAHDPAPAAPSTDLIDDEDRLTILIADDHADVRAYVRRHLEPTYRVLEAADGREALSLARHRLPDLIVSDVMMPELDGYALTRMLRSDPETAFLPIVLLTGRGGREDRIEGLNAEADDYLVKPVDPAELRARVDNLIAQRRRLRALVETTEPGRSEGGGDPTDPSAQVESFAARVRSYIAEHLTDDDLNVESLAEALAVSRTQLYRRVKSETEQTPTDLIRQVRLDCAADLLRRGQGNVSEVAYAVGFGSVAHFSRSFRAAYGVPPSAYEG